MRLTTRAKNILLTPGKEWLVIDTETETPSSLLVKYVIPMALVPAVSAFIGYGLIGTFGPLPRTQSLALGSETAINNFVSSLAGYMISTYVVDALGPSFGSGRNAGRSAQLVAYSYTPFWVAGIFYILPSLAMFSLLGLYGIYLFYLGVPVLKRTPEDKRLIYMIVSAIVIIVVWCVVNFIINLILLRWLGDPAGFISNQSR